MFVCFYFNSNDIARITKSRFYTGKKPIGSKKKSKPDQIYFFTREKRDCRVVINFNRKKCFLINFVLFNNTIWFSLFLLVGMTTLSNSDHSHPFLLAPDLWYSGHWCKHNGHLTDLSHWHVAALRCLLIFNWIKNLCQFQWFIYSYCCSCSSEFLFIIYFYFYFISFVYFL